MAAVTPDGVRAMALFVDPQRAQAEFLSLCCPEEFGEEGLRACLLTTKPFAPDSAGMQIALLH